MKHKKILIFLLILINKNIYSQININYYENFDQSSNLPNNWSKIDNPNLGAIVDIYNNGLYYSLPNALEIKSGGPTSGEVIAVSPEILDLDNNKMISFFVRKQANVGTSLYIGTMEDPQDETSFHPIEHIISNSIPYDQWLPFSVLFTNYNNNDHYIAFKHGRESVGQSILIDNFEYIQNPNASIIDNTNLGFKITPNPVTDYIVINSEASIVENLVIYNILGKKIMVKDNYLINEKLDVSNLKSGIYLIKINNNIQKFIKK